MRTIKMIITIILATCILFVAYGMWCNKALELNEYTVKSEKLPESFDGFKIVHVSDLHNSEMGRDNEKLLSMIADAQPDVITITGDLLDSRRTDLEVAMTFIEDAVKIAPCYYVTGNHEQRIDLYPELKNFMINEGVNVLDNRKMVLENGMDQLIIAGVDDPMFTMDPTKEEPYMIMEATLGELLKEDAGYTVLLSHRPELFDEYVQSNADLVLCGHAHGGQIRIPVIGGVISPGEGMFPEYYEGVHKKGGTHMVISRGIGNSLFPLRINNRPEVGLVVLKAI